MIENWPEGKVEEMEAVNNPEDPTAGTRAVPFSGELYIEQDDFREVPPPKYYRLFPGNQVRLRYAYIVTCTGVTKDPATGEITEVRCTYDPATRGGNAPDNRKVKATIHWVSAAHALRAEARLYDHLFAAEYPPGRARRRGLEGHAQPRLPRDRGGTRGSSRPSRGRPRERGSSSSGWATSASIRTRGRAHPCSTGSSR